MSGELPFLVYAALTVAFTFPLVLNLTTRLPYDLGDPLLTAAVLWWNATATPFTDTWWNGFGFFPAAGSTAFSADQLGASVISTPLQWLGAGPITAYNLLFLLAWPLSALAAHYCGLVLTGRTDAAFVAGLAYGFNPLRVAHVEHLELLMTFGMAAALAALHQYRATRRPVWAAAFGAALVVQALSSSYYALFFTVFFGLWIVWFVRPTEWRTALMPLAAGAIAVMLVSPIFLGYSRIHEAYGMQRQFQEVLAYSADLSSLVTASALSALWGWTSPLNGGERQLFPGLTLVLLALAGLFLLRRSNGGASARWRLGTRVSAALAVAFAVVAVLVAATGPIRLEWGCLRISATDIYKPLSMAVAFGTVAIAMTAPARAAFRERSMLAFYLLAALVLFACSLGPEPTLLGRRILYQPPYAWLMQLPYFDDTVRVPARFGMLAVLALSLAGALVFAQLAARRPVRRWLLAVVVAGILADGWMRTFPLAAAPGGFAIPAPAASAAAVLELPLGDVMDDTAAMYRVTMHGKRTVNGYNGYDPIYYRVLRQALADRDDTALDALASFGPLLVAVDRNRPGHEDWAGFVSRQDGVTRLEDDGSWMLFQVPQQSPQPEPACAGTPLPVVNATFDGVALNAAVLAGRAPAERWISPQPQRKGNTLIFDTGRVERLCGIAISRGTEAELYERAIEVATSVDGRRWEPGLTRRMGGAALLGALENPRNQRLWIELPGQEARFVRVRLTASDPRYQWAIAGVDIRAAR
jgi:hypothetical protein